MLYEGRLSFLRVLQHALKSKAIIFVSVTFTMNLDESFSLRFAKAGISTRRPDAEKFDMQTYGVVYRIGGLLEFEES